MLTFPWVVCNTLKSAQNLSMHSAVNYHKVTGPLRVDFELEESSRAIGLPFWLNGDLVSLAGPDPRECYWGTFSEVAS